MNLGCSVKGNILKEVYNPVHANPQFLYPMKIPDGEWFSPSSFTECLVWVLGNFSFTGTTKSGSSMKIIGYT